MAWLAGLDVTAMENRREQRKRKEFVSVRERERVNGTLNSVFVIFLSKSK
jgi:hypothetical protein